MALTHLRLENVRCLTAAELALHPGHNLVLGPNGAGKTSLLEAIYLLGRGRSFRTRRTEALIRHGATGLRVSGHTQSLALLSPDTSGGLEHRLKVSCVPGEGVEARIDARAADSLAELAEVFAVQAIDPGIHRLVEEGPVARRRWLDWAVFHVEPGFVPAWQDYGRALRQRNAALRAKEDPSPWTQELVRLGERLTAARARLLEGLQPLWLEVRTALDTVPASLSFYPGWRREQTLGEAIERHLARDRIQGLTSVGPHRFDALLRIEGRPARDVVSRGQQKLLGAALALVMARYVAQARGQAPTLLLDDPAAELDEAHTAALLAAVRATGAQLVITALHADDPRLGMPDRVFHVERGEVRQRL
jgi:DNA replication and repair protein RecF